MENSKKLKYRSFCNKEDKMPLFSKDWWLDTVCGKENWDVILVERGDTIVASLPFYLKISRKLNIRTISMPSLTQVLGPYIKYPNNQKYERRLSFEKEAMTELVDNLPSFDTFTQNFHYSITNWLPFYWRGFSQSTRYTYVLEDLSNLDLIWNNFSTKIRGKIRKAEKKVKIVSNDDIDLFYEINKKTFTRQNMRIPYSFELITELDKVLKNNGRRKILFAKDKNGLIHAGIYLVWDDSSVYYLMGGSDPQLRDSGAYSLLIWKAIEFSSTILNKFDFEGSMLESVETFFRSFGAVQKPYFKIKKTNSKVIKVLECINSLRL